MSDIVARLEAEEQRMLRLHDVLAEARDKYHGEPVFAVLNGFKHAVAGRDPVLLEAAAHIRALEAEVERLKAEKHD